MQSDHWFHELFRAMPDLVRQLLPQLASLSGEAPEGNTLEPSGAGGEEPSIGEGSADGSQESIYSFRPVVLKKAAHSPDGLLWPRSHPGGSQRWPVVLLEVQMHPDRRFQRRLAAETFRLLQQQEQIEHLQVLVLLAHRRLALGSGGPALLQRFLRDEVTWVDLESLASRSDLDPSLALLTLPVQAETSLLPCCQRLLGQHPDWLELIIPILNERLAGLSTEQIMATLRISPDLWRHTRMYQEILAEGRQEGRQEALDAGRQEGRDQGRRQEASALTLRQLTRRCGPISPEQQARIEALDLPMLQELALALLDFQGPDDLAAWLRQQGG